MRSSYSRTGRRAVGVVVAAFVLAVGLVFGCGSSFTLGVSAPIGSVVSVSVEGVDAGVWVVSDASVRGTPRGRPPVRLGDYPSPQGPAHGDLAGSSYGATGPYVASVSGSDGGGGSVRLGTSSLPVTLVAPYAGLGVGAAALDGGGSYVGLIQALDGGTVGALYLGQPDGGDYQTTVTGYLVTCVNSQAPAGAPNQLCMTAGNGGLMGLHAGNYIYVSNDTNVTGNVAGYSLIILPNDNGTTQEYFGANTTPFIGVEAQISDAATHTWSMVGQSAFAGAGGTNQNGGAVNVIAGSSTTPGSAGRSGAARMCLNGSASLCLDEVAEPVLGQRVVALGQVGSGVVATNVPDAGDGLVFVANAQTQPGGICSGGAYLTSNAGVLTGMNCVDGGQAPFAVPTAAGPTVTWAGDLGDGGSTNSTQTVVAISGTSPIPVAPAQLAWSSTTAAPTWTQTVRASTGANAGANMSWTAQAGQQQTGGANNNAGGDAVITGGAAGTGGGGTAGTNGFVDLNAGATSAWRFGLLSGTTATKFAAYPAGATADATHHLFYWDTANNVLALNTQATINFTYLGSNTKMVMGASGLQIGSATNFGSASDTNMLGLSDGAFGAGVPSNGLTLQSVAVSGGNSSLTERNKQMTFTLSPAGVGTVNSQAQTIDSRAGYLQVTSSAAATIVTYAQATSATTGFYSAQIVCRATTAPTSGAIGDSWATQFGFTIRNVGGTLTQVGSTVALATNTDTSETSMLASVAVSGTNVLVKVAGPTGVSAGVNDCTAYVGVVID